jgi:hypothetical protein
LEFRKAGQTPFVREAEVKRQGETVEIQVREDDWKGAVLAMGTLIMVLDPLDAAVEIDGRPVTLVEGKTEMIPGKHTYRVSRDGYADKTGSFDVKTGKTATVSAKLKPVSTAKAEAEGEKKKSSKKFLYIGAAAVGAAAIVAVAAGGGGGGGGGPTGPLPPPPPPPSKPTPGGRRQP